MRGRGLVWGGVERGRGLVCGGRGMVGVGGGGVQG